jgi:hypothetical protein
MKASHKAAHYSHKAALITATGKAKKYHKTMAKFHGKQGGILDAVMVLDAVPTGDLEGVIRKGAEVVGRAAIAGGDGKSMIYVGKEGDERVKPADGDYTFYFTEDGQSQIAMVQGLAASLKAGATAAPQLAEVSAEAAKYGMTAEVESNQFVKDLSYFSIKKEGASVGRLYADKDGWDGYFQTETAYGEVVGTFGLKDAMDKIAKAAEPVKPTETKEPAVPTESPEKAADRAYLNSLIDGTGDLLAADTFDRLEPLFARYEGDAEMMALLEKAATVYGDAAVAAAQAALAPA